MSVTPLDLPDDVVAFLIHLQTELAAIRQEIRRLAEDDELRALAS